MEIKILGSCCKNCEVLEDHAKQAMKSLGVEGEVRKVTDFKDIASYGVMRTPGLVIDGKVVSVGKVLSAKEIEALLTSGK